MSLFLERLDYLGETAMSEASCVRVSLQQFTVLAKEVGGMRLDLSAWFSGFLPFEACSSSASNPAPVLHSIVLSSLLTVGTWACCTNLFYVCRVPK
jgi:hypothetical protein